MLIIDSFLDGPTRESLLADNDSFPGLPADNPDISTIINEYHDSTKSHYSPFCFWDGWWNSEEDTIKKVVIRGRLPVELETIYHEIQILKKCLYEFQSASINLANNCKDSYDTVCKPSICNCHSSGEKND